MMTIAGKECLPLLHGDVHGDQLLHLDKGGVMRLINGDPMPVFRVLAEFGYLDFSYTIPLKLVPLRWGLEILLVFYKLSGIRRPMWYHEQWDKLVRYQDPVKRVSEHITDFKIGVVKE